MTTKGCTCHLAFDGEDVVLKLLEPSTYEQMVFGYSLSAIDIDVANNIMVYNYRYATAIVDCKQVIVIGYDLNLLKLWSK